MCVCMCSSMLQNKEAECYDLQGLAFVQNCKVKSQISSNAETKSPQSPSETPSLPMRKPAFPVGFHWFPHTHLKSLVRLKSLTPRDWDFWHGLGSPASLHGSLGASLQGMTLAKEIRDQERGGRTYVAVVDGENEKASPQLMEVMNHVLGKRRELKAAVPDTVVEPALKAALKLYQ